VRGGPVLVAAAVVFDGGRVLLTQRMKGAHLSGLWEFPGGKLEPGEAPEDAVVRECREECGIELRVVDIFDVSFHAYPEREVLVLFYECELVSGEVQPLGVADHVWCAPADIDAYELPAADVRVVQKIKARADR
jgi:8-oxo-dGTP diphosphatase